MLAAAAPVVARGSAYGWASPEPALDDGRRGAVREIEQAAVGGDERGVESLGQRDVRGVIAAQVVAEGPDAGEERPRRVALERQLVQVTERLGRPAIVETSAEHVLAEDVCDLGVDEVWRRMLPSVSESSLDPVEVRLVAEQEVERGGGVEHDHRAS